MGQLISFQLYFFFPQENLSDEQIAGMINYSVLIIMLQKRGLFSKQIFLKHSKGPLSFKLTRNALFGTVISSRHQLKPAKHFFLVILSAKIHMHRKRINNDRRPSLNVMGLLIMREIMRYNNLVRFLPYFPL